jgi:MtfA peptidase
MGVIKRWQQARALQRRAIAEPLWAQVLEQHPFIAQRSHEDRESLRKLCSLFLDQKEFSGAGGFVVTDEVAVSVASQACLPILHLDLALYDSFVGIVMHADEVLAPRVVSDENGLVHEYSESLVGEAPHDGPIMLSWADVHNPMGSQDRHETDPGWAFNVVIHEFVHVIDRANGGANGLPPMPDAASARAWLAVLEHEHDVFRERVVCGHPTVIDPYGAQSLEEFFATASESFFVTPQALRQSHPTLYDCFSGYFRQDPARWIKG